MPFLSTLGLAMNGVKNNNLRYGGWLMTFISGALYYY